MAGFIILSYYSVIAGWTLHYFKMSLLGELSNLDSESVQTIFGELTGSAITQLMYHTAFMAITVAIIAKGIKDGLERAVKYTDTNFRILCFENFESSIPWMKIIFFLITRPIWNM